MIKTKNSFTLIELLIVVAIIAILAGLLLPALQASRNKARTLTCATNLKNLSLSAVQYADDWNDINVGWHSASTKWTWYSLLKPYGYDNRNSLKCPVDKNDGYALHDGLSFMKINGNKVFRSSGTLHGYGGPSTIAWFADSVWPNFANWYPLSFGSDWSNPKFVFLRHNRTINAACADGHVSAGKPGTITSTTVSSLTPTTLYW